VIARAAIPLPASLTPDWRDLKPDAMEEQLTSMLKGVC
jgi:hypothetical protein